MQVKNTTYTTFVLATVLCLSGLGPAQERSRGQRQPTSRRTQRVVQMKEVQVAGPDGKVKFTLGSNPERLTYTVMLGDTTVIEPSSLDMRVDGYDLSSGVTFNNLEQYKTDETYPWHGVHSTAVNRCNGAKISITNDLSQMAYVLEVRAFNDGVAYRHVIAGDADAVRVPNEYSQFVLPAGSTVWYHDLQGHYEGVHARKAVGEVKAGEWVAPPLTFRLPAGAGYGSISEGGLADYPGMALQADGARSFLERLGHSHPASYPFTLRFASDVNRVSRPASITGTIRTPWRVVLVGRDLDTLVNSDIIHDVSEPPDPRLFPKGMETSWLKPGRAVWRYLDGGSTSLDGMKEFSRLAGALGFEYNVLEGFWESWPDSQLKELADYSRSYGVGLILWKHRGTLGTEAARQALWARCRAVGAAGLKIDFFDHEAKEVIDLYHILLRETAENQLVVDFHGANKPAGESRSFPNEMTREAVRGLEASSVTAWAGHTTTLPFTRMLAGHLDFTAVIFGSRRRETSWTHQITTAAVFNSPLLVYAAHPQSLVDSPGVEMIKSIPSVWDETVVLPSSEIGELAAFARRSGSRWFLAVLNGPTARSTRFDLSFLGSGVYDAFVLKDQLGEPAALQVETTTATRTQTLDAEMRAGGGFIACFTPR